MVRAADDIDAPSGFAEFAPVSSKISTASHGRVPAQADVSVLRADLADRLGDLYNGLNVRDAVSGLAFVRWSRDREDDWYTCDVALEVLPGELVGVGDAIVLESWPVACAQIGRDHLMLRNSRMPIEKNPWAVRVRSPSGGASDGVFYVFVGRHGIETVSGAKLLLNLSGLTCLTQTQQEGGGGRDRMSTYWQIKSTFSCPRRATGTQLAAKV